MNSKNKTEENDLDQIISSVKIPTNNLEILQLIHKLLRTLSPFIQILMALIGLGIAGYYGSKLTDRFNNSQENVARALEARLVTTAYAHRGVTAFLLADIDKTLSTMNGYGPELEKVFNEVSKAISKSPKDLENFDPKNADSLHLMVNVDSASTSESELDLIPNWKKAITNSEQDMDTMFLMVPAISLRRVNPVYDSKTKTNHVNLVYEPLRSKNLTEVLKYNPEVAFDLMIASDIKSCFMNLNQILAQSLDPVQTYFISESGVILLQKSFAKSKFYSRKFPRYTLFMDRTYFWGAIDPQPGEKNRDNAPFDYQTDPYIDLGGNGVVKTYSKKVELPNHRVGVICVDVHLPEGSVNEIKHRLNVLGANVQDFHWETRPGTYGNKVEEIPPGFGWVENRLKAQYDEQSRLLGAIAFESDYDSQKKEVIRFTVPVGSDEFDEKRITHLLLVSFDFARIRRSILLDSLGFLFGIGLLVLVTWNVFYDYNKLKREMNKVLENMSQVMYEAATPFVWLNEKNQFHKVNLSFLEVVGCKNDKELKEHAPTFRDLVTGETQPQYDEILAQSAKGEKTGQYEIDIIKKNGEVKHIVAHGERIPYPTFWRRGLPHRFGVILSWPPKPKTKGHKSTTSQPKLGDISTEPN